MCVENFFVAGAARFLCQMISSVKILYGAIQTLNLMVFNRQKTVIFRSESGTLSAILSPSLSLLQTFVTLYREFWDAGLFL